MKDKEFDAVRMMRETLGIKIHDHIIVSKNGHTSMKEGGWFRAPGSTFL
jgi:DNA repair protein RadC